MNSVISNAEFSILTEDVFDEVDDLLCNTLKDLKGE